MNLIMLDKGKVIFQGDINNKEVIMDRIEQLRKAFKYILENWDIKAESDIDNIVYLLIKEVKNEI